MEKIDVERRTKMAHEYFTSGYNCAQSVIMAYADVFECEAEALATVASAFGGGMGRLREVCGAVSGMAMAAGYIIPAADPNDRTAKSANYALIQEFAEEFRANNGSIICRELLGLSVRKEDPTPSARTAEYYKKRPCAELVAMAAAIVGRGINARL